MSQMKPQSSRATAVAYLIDAVSTARIGDTEAAVAAGYRELRYV